MSLIYSKIYNNVSELPERWNTLVAHDVFLQTPFLNALEQSCPNNINLYYIGVYSSNTLVGIIIMQWVEIYAKDIFRKSNDHYLKKISKILVAKIVRGNALVVGNLMHTGQHGIYFNDKKISQSVYLEEVFKALNKVSNQIKKTHNKRIRIIGFKDYFDNDRIHSSSEFFMTKNLYKIQVQPNMIFSLPTHWNMIEDYIFELKNKYKRRYKTARKKIGAINSKELTIKDLETASNILYSLYKNVSDNAKVNSFVLPQNHFISLKEHMQNNFKVFGYFLNNELVGFYTLILNNEILETYFLGYDDKRQSQHQIYLNMLFDMLTYAINNNFKTLVFARTAMEIKSSVGAKPNTMHIYMKHANNFIANKILKLIVNTLNPIKKWNERHPFK